MAADKPLQDIYNTVRIPLVDAVVATVSSNTGGLPFYDDSGLYWNCYPQMFTDKAQNQYASQFENWVEKRGPAVLKTSTIPDNATVPTANVTSCYDNICMTNLDDVYCAAIFDFTASLWRIIQYRPIANTSLQIGTIAGTVDATVFLTEATIAGVATLLVTYVNLAETVSTGAFAASVAGVMAAASLTVIVDVDYPANLANTSTRGGFIYMDGYAFVGSKQGGLYNSDLNSIISWNALNVISAIQYPDQGINLARYKNHILFFGEDSIEFFNNVNYNQGGVGSPLQRTDQAFIKFGAAGPKAIRSINDTVYWWARSTSSKIGLYRMDGYTPVKVSSLREDQWIQLYSLSAPTIHLLFDRGKTHLIMGCDVTPKMLSAASRISSASLFGQPQSDAFTSDPFSLSSSNLIVGFLCLDLDTGCFWLWSHAVSSNFWFPVMAANLSSNNFQGTYNNPGYGMWSVREPGLTSGSAGLTKGIYTFGDSTFLTYEDNDNGAVAYPITAGIQFNTWDFGNEKRKTIHKFKLIWKQSGPNTTGTPSPGITPYTWVIYNKQDGNLDNITNPNTVYKIWKRPIIQNSMVFRTYLNNLGSARKWTFAIIQKSNQPFAAKAIELDISQRG